MKQIEFNQGWKFKTKDQTESISVTLPHDAMLMGKRDADSTGGSACAFFSGNVYEYEKRFYVPEDWNEKHVEFHFDGVYRNAKVYINGKEAGGAAYGYIPFWVNADGLLETGKENIIRVIADNTEQPNSRWYSGGGIYRPVTMWIGGNHYVHPEQIRVTTLSINPVKICVEISMDTISTEEKVSVKVEVKDNDTLMECEQIEIDGKRCSGQEGSENESSQICFELELPDAKLWSETTPHLYNCQVTLLVNEKVCDIAEKRFGIRRLEWNNQGFFVNGVNTLLRGGCIHSDNGIIGAAAYKESEWRRVKKLKEAGYNALRISHNPASEDMLDACDSLGMYVIDEMWDMWYNKKNPYDYGAQFMEYYKQDITAIARRDYNHPSVIMYSIGNEVSEPAREKGIALAKEMVEYFHKLDASRPVTAGLNLMIVKSSAGGKGIYNEDGSGRDNAGSEKMNGMSSTMFNMIAAIVGTGMNKSANSKKADEITTPVLDSLDIAGYNYASGRYSKEGKIHPNRVLFGSETFPQDIAKNWTMVQKYPYLIGDFMWTAWDYLGEAGIGAWAYTEDAKGFEKPYPWLLADTGAMDILGNPNAELFWAQAAWGLLKNPVITSQPANHPKNKVVKGVWRGSNGLPTWSWKGCDGNKTVVEVFTDADAVELILNGKKIRKAKVKNCRAVFKTVYQPGKLEAVSYDKTGKIQGRSVLVSAKDTVGIHLQTEKETVAAGEIFYVDVTIMDENGIVESNADEQISVMVEGGELLGFGSANPRTEEKFDSAQYSTYYGRAQAIVRAGQGKSVIIKASGLHQSKCEVKIQ